MKKRNKIIIGVLLGFILSINVFKEKTYNIEINDLELVAEDDIEIPQYIFEHNFKIKYKTNRFSKISNDMFEAVFFSTYYNMREELEYLNFYNYEKNIDKFNSNLKFNLNKNFKLIYKKVKIKKIEYKYKKINDE